jgi:hypothetical protein
MRPSGTACWSVQGPILAAAVFFACGGGGASGPAFDEDANPTIQTASDAGTSAPVDSGRPALADDSAYVGFGPIADVEAGPKVDCQPGTYTGMFATTVTADGGLFALLGTSFGWGGDLSLTLTGTTKMVEAGSGEFMTDYTVLTIAPGAKLSGTDMYGGQFSADVSGQLDCPSRRLIGTMNNGIYLLPGLGDAGAITMNGTLSATYDPSTSPVTLTNGTITGSSPQVASLSADGTWTATHQ